MAIVIEEEKKPINWFSILTTLLFIVLIFSAVYYSFFVSPPFIEVVIPIKLKEAADIAKITFDPGVLINSQTFKNLRQHALTPTAGELGRDNPFLPYGR